MQNLHFTLDFIDLSFISFVAAYDFFLPQISAEKKHLFLSRFISNSERDSHLIFSSNSIIGLLILPLNKTSKDVMISHR